MKNAVGFGLKIVILVGASLFLGGGWTQAQQAPAETPKEDYVKAHYTKYEYRIPMRDGKKLFTSVYVPKDDSQKYPILMDRTPYSVGPYGEDSYKKSLGPSEEFQKAGTFLSIRMCAGAICPRANLWRCILILIARNRPRMWMTARTCMTRLNFC